VKPAGIGVTRRWMVCSSTHLLQRRSYYLNIALVNTARPAVNKWVTSGFGYTCQQQNEWSRNGLKVAYKTTPSPGRHLDHEGQRQGKVRLTESSYVDYVDGTDPCYNNPPSAPTASTSPTTRKTTSTSGSGS